MYKIILFASILVATSSYANTFMVSNVAEFRVALENAALNGESDTIVLEKGVYHTDSDGIGAFTFSDEEAYDLTVEADTGLTAEDVILDGDGLHQVFTYDNTQYTPRLVTLKNISFINGGTEGRCIYTDHENVTLENCFVSSCPVGGVMSWDNVTLIHSTVSNCQSGSAGGGVYAGDLVKIIDSTISNNYAESKGGGFYQNSSSKTAQVIRSTISNNSVKVAYNGSTYGGGFYTAAAYVSESNITNNSAKRGGGFYAGTNATVDKSIISENLANGAGGFYVARVAQITNSLFSNNRAYQGNATLRAITFESGNGSYIINNNFIDNEGEVMTGGIFINNIFDSSTSNVLTLKGDTKLYHTYIDYTKITQYDHGLIKRNNLQPAIVGDVKLWVDDLTLKTGSPAIDNGLNPSSQLFEDTIDDGARYADIVQKLNNDIFINSRNYNGTTIDIGASEYGYADYPLRSITLTPIIMYMLK